MYNFILQTVVMLSLGTLIYLASRSVPRISEMELKSEPWSAHLDRLANKLPLEKADAFTSYWLEKMLRQLKVVILKLDNLLTKHLRSLKTSPEEAKKPDLFGTAENSSAKPDSVEESQKIL